MNHHSVHTINHSLAHQGSQTSLSLSLQSGILVFPGTIQHQLSLAPSYKRIVQICDTRSQYHVKSQCVCPYIENSSSVLREPTQSWKLTFPQSVPKRTLHCAFLNIQYNCYMIKYTSYLWYRASAELGALCCRRTAQMEYGLGWRVMPSLGVTEGTVPGGNCR